MVGFRQRQADDVKVALQLHVLPFIATADISSTILKPQETNP